MKMMMMTIVWWVNYYESLETHNAPFQVIDIDSSLLWHHHGMQLIRNTWQVLSE